MLEGRAPDRDGDGDGRDERSRSSDGQALVDALVPAMADLSGLADDVLAETSRIDRVAIDASGRVHIILFGEAGTDAALFTRALAARAWVEARLADWIQLAPERGIDPSLAVQAIAVCAHFEAETRSAAAALGGGPVRLIESARTPAPSTSLAAPALAASRRPRPASPVAAPAPGTTRGSRFRSGLTDSDLGLEDAPGSAARPA